MFTGLVEETGTIAQLEPRGDGRVITISATTVLEDAAVDDSISVNGICLTVTSRTADTFTVTAVAETLGKTTLGAAFTGQRVNLERAVRLQDRLGGHLVQGHVDCTGTVDAIVHNDQGCEIWIAFPERFRKWLIPVGSVTINGVSLTVADLEAARLKVALIPHTLHRTTLGSASVGSSVNIEFDLVAKYLENFIQR